MATGTGVSDTSRMATTDSPALSALPTPSPRSLAKVLLKMVPLALVVGSVTTAAAASIGLSPSSFGGGSAEVASCDDAFGVSYTTAYDEISGKYQITEAVVDDIDDVACAGHTLDVVVAGENFVSLATGTATVSASTVVVTLSTPADADAVRSVALVITD
jgi:hypothetical protein